MNLDATVLGMFMIGWFLFYLFIFHLLKKYHDMSPPLKVLGAVLWLIPPVGLLFLIFIGVFTKRISDSVQVE